jgi:hypothetical protein
VSVLKTPYLQITALFLLLASTVIFPAAAAGEELLMTDYAGHFFHASSSLDGYGMELLFDGDSYTGWAEGLPGAGEGVVLWAALDPGSDTLLVRNGFSRSRALFYKNNRVRSMELSLYRGFQPAGMVTEIGPLFIILPLTSSISITLEDSMELQDIALPFERDLLSGQPPSDEELRFFTEYTRRNNLSRESEAENLILRMEITDVYPGSTWNDTCLTELRLFSEDDFSSAEVYGEEGSLFYSSPTGRRILCRDREYLYDPYLVSRDGSWCIAFKTPAVAQGRVESSFSLFRLPRPEPYRNGRFEAAIDAGLIPVDFEERPEGLYLLFDDGSDLRLISEAGR